VIREDNNNSNIKIKLLKYDLNIINQPIIKPNIVSDYNCHICNENFVTRNKLYQHIKIHTENRNNDKDIISKEHIKNEKDLIDSIILFFNKRNLLLKGNNNNNNNSKNLLLLSDITSDRKIKNYLRSFYRSLPISILKIEERYEYETSEWWKSASYSLINLLHNNENIFKFHFPDSTKFYTVHNLRTVYIELLINIEVVNNIELINDVIDNNEINNDESNNIIPKKKTITIKEPKFNIDDLSILYQSKTMIFVYKPAGIDMKSLISCCNDWHKDWNNKNSIESSYIIDSVSRLDQPTSGVVVIPLTKLCEDYLKNLFKTRQVGKNYICIVIGDIKERSTSSLTSGHSIDMEEVCLKLKHVDSEMKSFVSPSGKISVTKYHCIETIRNINNDIVYSIVLCKPITGRTHQIRAHMSSIGYPLLGDLKYDRSQGRSKKKFKNGKNASIKFLNVDRLMLHSYLIDIKLFDNISNDEDLKVTSIIPDDIINFLVNFNEICNLDERLNINELINKIDNSVDIFKLTKD
jgi:23S rRNA-/tRNA-specific pseudouridylate synthase